MNSFIKNYLRANISGYVKNGIKNINSLTRFDMGEIYLPPTPKIKKILNSYNIHGLSHYPNPDYTDMKKIVAKKHKVNIKNILLTAGAVEAISIIPRVLCEPGDTSVLTMPTFFWIQKANSLFKVKNCFVKLFEKNNFEYDKNFISRFIYEIKVNSARTAWVCTPNNPTGNVLSIQNLRNILNNINPRCYLIVDEAYHDFYDPRNNYSAIKLIKKYPNLIVIRSLSKSYGVANARLGYVIASQNIIQAMSHLPIFNISGLNQKIALAALSDQKYLEHIVEKATIETKRLITKIVELKNYVISDYTHCNIFLLRHKHFDLYKKLLQRDILTADFRHCKGLEGKKFIRITAQNQKKNRVLLTALRRIDGKMC